MPCVCLSNTTVARVAAQTNQPGWRSGCTVYRPTQLIRSYCYTSTVLPSSLARRSVQARAEDIHGIATPDQAVIKVIGVGGGGSNVVNRMMEDEIVGVEAWVVNTDAQALATSKVDPARRIQIGAKLTRGLGAGGNPEIGLKAAKESREAIENALKGADLVVVTAGLGGGTGSGAAPQVCEIAQSMDILTVAFATLPFTFEGRHRRSQARDAGQRIATHCDTMVVVPNDKLLDPINGGNLALNDAFKVADSALVQGVRGISDIILIPGMINVDFADVKAIMQGAGNSHMATGIGTGKERAVSATLAAIQSPLLETNISSASGVVWNITGPADLSLGEVNAAADLIYDVADEDANIIFGAVINAERSSEEVQVTLILTGFQLPAGEVPLSGRFSKQPAMDSGSKSAVRIPSFLQRKGLV